MQEKPTISVTITTYNRAHLLPRAINSVLNQTYQNFELIIVDDCSTDNTKEVINTFSDSRIIYHRHTKNKGLLAATNTGWELTRGKYTCKLDDDDELLPNALEIVNKKFSELNQKGVKFLWFNCINAEMGKLCSIGLKKEGYITYEDVLSSKVQGDFWQVIDMELLGENRYNEGWWGGSGILWLRLLRKSMGYYIPETLYKAYRKHGVRMTFDRKSIIQHLSKILLLEMTFLEENGRDLKRLAPKKYGLKLNELGFYQMLKGDINDGRKTFYEAFKFHFSFKYFILFLFSFLIKSKQLKIFYIKFFNIG